MKSRSAIAFLLLLLVCLACTNNVSHDSQGGELSSESATTLGSIDFNILNYNSSYRNLFSENVHATNISLDEITECEILVRDYIKGYNDEAERKYDDIDLKQYKIDLENYGRQYIAVLTDTDEKVIYANFFCDPESFDYRKSEMVQVEDGGSCYFRCWIVLKSDKILLFAQNAVADGPVTNIQLLASKR